MSIFDERRGKSPGRTFCQERTNLISFLLDSTPFIRNFVIDNQSITADMKKKKRNLEPGRIVKEVRFNMTLDGVTERVKLDLTDPKDPVTRDYIFSEDGPWCFAEFGEKIYDFQVWAEPEHKKLCISVVNYTPEDGRGDWVYDRKISNIRVIYQ